MPGNWLWSQVFAFWRHWNVKIKSASSYRTFNILENRSLISYINISTFFRPILKRITDYRCQCHCCYSANMQKRKMEKDKSEQEREREKPKAYLVCRFNFYSSALQRAFLLKRIYSLKYVILCVSFDSLSFRLYNIRKMGMKYISREKRKTHWK